MSHNFTCIAGCKIVTSYLPFAEESQGEIEVKDPCACESLVEFQQATMAAMDQLNQKHILYESVYKFTLFSLMLITLPSTQIQTTVHSLFMGNGLQITTHKLPVEQHNTFNF